MPHTSGEVAEAHPVPLSSYQLQLAAQPALVAAMLLCGLPPRGRGVFSTGGESLGYLRNLRMQLGLLPECGVKGEEGKFLCFFLGVRREGRSCRWKPPVSLSVLFPIFCSLAC